MKNIFFICFCALFAFSGCADDDDDLLTGGNVDIDLLPDAKDVYKRQQLHQATGSILFRCQNLLQTKRFKHCLVPVSYTHLDETKQFFFSDYISSIILGNFTVMYYLL